MDTHVLTVSPGPRCTRAACSCGGWAREASADTLVVTGRSRTEALRVAFEEHAAGAA